MNDTNRALNRIFVLVVGLVLLLGGGAVAAGALLPDVRSTVSDAAEQATGPTTDALSGGLPWVLWVTALAALVLVVLLLALVVRQGGGRTGTLTRLRSQGPSGGVGGDVVVETRTAADAIEAALKEDDAFVSASVSSWRVKGTTVLRVAVDVRKGVSPRDAHGRVDQVVAAWDRVLGQELPVVVQLDGGLRSQLASGVGRAE